MRRRPVPVTSVAACLFLLGWLASVLLAPSCKPAGSWAYPFDGGRLWVVLLGPGVAWLGTSRVRALIGARHTETRPKARWPKLALLLLMAGVVGCVLSLGCGFLETAWPTWAQDDAFQLFAQLPSQWKAAGLALMALGVLGLAVERVKAR